MGDRWALIVGVGKYQDRGLDLRYAANDALALRDACVSPALGFAVADRERDIPAEARVRLLTNEDATLKNLTEALRSWLRRTAKGDLVLLFFSCHGGVDRANTDVGYLLPHDVDLNDIARTAMPMWELQACLEHTLAGRHVVLLIDACHAGGMVEGTKGAESLEVGKFLERELRATRPGVAVLASSSKQEQSREGPQWGGGHGVFTYHLLEGLRGAADRSEGHAPADGVITIGELFDHVVDNVSAATQGEQNPVISGEDFDRGLALCTVPIADVVKGKRLVTDLTRLGQAADEPLLIEAAARQCERILQYRIPGRQPGDLHRRLAELRLSKGHPDDTLDALSGVRATGPAALVEALAALRSADGTRARDALSRVGRARDLGPYPRLLERWLETGPPLRTRALLIAVEQTKAGGQPKLSARRDVALVQSVLDGGRALGYPTEIEILNGEAVTGSAIRESLAAMAVKCSPDDAVVVYYTGFGWQRTETDAFLMGTDVVTGADQDAMVSSTDLDQALRAIRAARVTVIVEAGIPKHFTELASEAPYAAMLAAHPGETLMIHRSASLSTTCGLFTDRLTEILLAGGPGAAFGGTARATIELFERGSRPQHPWWNGRGDASLDAVCDELTAVNLAVGASGEALDASWFNAVLSRLVEAPCRPPSFTRTVARGLAARGRHRQAAALLTSEQSVGNEDTAAAVAAAALRADDPDSAALALTGQPGRAARSALNILKRSQLTTPTVLLVAPDPDTAVDDIAAAMAEAIGGSATITSLVGPQATADAVLAGVHRLLETAAGGPALLACRGALGFDLSGSHLVLVTAGARANRDGVEVGQGVRLDELAEITQVAGNLVSLFALTSLDLAPEEISGIAGWATPIGRLSLLEINAPDTGLDERLVELLQRAGLGSDAAELVGPSTSQLTAERNVSTGLFLDRAAIKAAQDALSDPRRRQALRLIRSIDEMLDMRPQAELRGARGIAERLAGNPAQGAKDLEAALGLAGPDLRVDLLVELARLFFDGRIDLNRAVSLLKEAVEANDERADAQLLLARAVRAVMEEESGQQAVQAYRRYLDLGAPLGYEAEARAYTSRPTT